MHSEILLRSFDSDGTDSMKSAQLLRLDGTASSFAADSPFCKYTYALHLRFIHKMTG